MRHRMFWTPENEQQFMHCWCNDDEGVGENAMRSWLQELLRTEELARRVVERFGPLGDLWVTGTLNFQKGNPHAFVAAMRNLRDDLNGEDKMQPHLPDEYVDYWAAKAKGGRFMGAPVEQFTRDELLAVIGALSQHLSYRVGDEGE